MSSESSTPKLKLKLKLNSSSSSTSSNNPSSVPVTSSIAVSALPSSNLTSSVNSSPQKRSESGDHFVNILGGEELMEDLPAGLGNLKGRGRPKKAPGTDSQAETTTTADSTGNETGSQTMSSVITEQTALTTTTTTASEKTEYSTHLKNLANSMKTFTPRHWNLKRPFAAIRNLAGYEVSLPCGFWCTDTAILPSSHLIASKPEIGVKSGAVEAVPVPPKQFQATCQCGKLFTDRSKYRKHVKIHDKSNDGSKGSVVQKTLPSASSSSAVPDAIDVNVAPVQVQAPQQTVPVISLKFKFNSPAGMNR